MRTMKYLREKKEVGNEILILWIKRTKKKAIQSKFKVENTFAIISPFKTTLSVFSQHQTSRGLSKKQLTHFPEINASYMISLCVMVGLLYPARLLWLANYFWPITTENISIHHVFSKYRTTYLAHVVVLMVRAFLVKRHCFLGDHLALQ